MLNLISCQTKMKNACCGKKGNTFTFPGDLYLLLTESIFRNELVERVKKLAHLSVLGLVVGRSITPNPGSISIA